MRYALSVHAFRGHKTDFGILYALACWAACAAFWWHHYPQLFQHSEMWAEAATNYFVTARTRRWQDAFCALDAGYIPLLPRLIAQVLGYFHTLTPWIPLLYQSFALGASSFFVSLFCWPRYRRWVRPDSLRFVICLGLLAHSDYELKTFINFAYLGYTAFLLTLAELPFLTSASTCNFIYMTIGLALLALSKPAFLAFFPTTCILTIWLLLQKRRAASLCTVALLTSFALQFSVLVASAPPTHYNREVVTRLGLVAFNNIASVIAITFNLACLSNTQRWNATRLLPMLGTLAGVAFFLRFICIKRRVRDLWFLAVASSSAIAAIVLIRLAFINFPPLEQITVESISTRFWFFPSIALYFIVACGLANSYSEAQILRTHIVLALWLCATAPFGFHRVPYAPGWPVTGFSDWQHYGVPTYAHTPPDGCIPADPYGHIQRHQCALALPLPSAQEVSRPALIPLSSTFPTPHAIAAMCIRMVGFVVANASGRPIFMRGHDELTKSTVGTSVGHLAPGGHVLWFDFAPCVTGLTHLQLSGPGLDDLGFVMSTDDDHIPHTLWFTGIH